MPLTGNYEQLIAQSDLITWQNKGDFSDWNNIPEFGRSGYKLSCTNGGKSSYITFTTPSNPDYFANLGLGGDEFFLSNGEFEYAQAWCWISDRLGGPPLAQNGLMQVVDGYPNNLGGQSWEGGSRWRMNNEGWSDAEAILNPSTQYYFHLAPQYFRDKARSGISVALNFSGEGVPYIEVPPPPPPPPPPPVDPPPVDPPPPVVDPPDPEEPPVPPVVVPPPATEGPNTPPDNSNPLPGEDGYVAPADVTQESSQITADSQGKVIRDEAAKLVTPTIYKEVGSGIPEPQADVQSLYRTVHALKVSFEQLTRQRGDRKLSALLVEEVDKVMEAATREFDKRYATEFDDVTLDADTAYPTELNNSSDIANALAKHLTDTALHLTDAPTQGVWGRRRGTWIRVAAFEELAQYIPQLAGGDGISSVEEDEAPVLGGDMDIASNAFKTELPVGGVTLSPGQVCYMDATGTMQLADASDEATSKTLIAINLTSVNELSKGPFLLWGFYNLPGVLAGQVLYLDPLVPGGLTAVVPSGSGHVIRVVAYAVADDRVFFAPDRTWIVAA